MQNAHPGKCATYGCGRIVRAGQGAMIRAGGRLVLHCQDCAKCLTARESDVRDPRTAVRTTASV